MRNLGDFYKKVKLHLGEDVNWDTDLVERFLLTRPKIAYLIQLLGDIDYFRRRVRLIGYVPIKRKNRLGHFEQLRGKRGHYLWKLDKKRYMKLLKSEIERKREFMNNVIRNNNKKLDKFAQALIITEPIDPDKPV